MHLLTHHPKGGDRAPFPAKPHQRMCVCVLFFFLSSRCFSLPHLSFFEGGRSGTTADGKETDDGIERIEKYRN